MNIFVSYASSDVPHVGALLSEKDQLPFKEDFKLWVAYQKRGNKKNIEPGSSFAPVITEAIKNSTGAILLLSESFLKAEFITEVELPAIFNKKSKDSSYQIIPILINRNIDYSNYPALEGIQLSNSPTTPLADQTGNSYRLILRDALDQLNYNSSKFRIRSLLNKINKHFSALFIIVSLLIYGLILNMVPDANSDFEQNIDIISQENELIDINQSLNMLLFPDGQSQEYFTNTSPLKKINIFDNTWNPFEPFPVTIDVANYMSSEDTGIPVGDYRYDENYAGGGIIPNSIEFCPTQETFNEYPVLYFDEKFPPEYQEYFRLTDMDSNGRFEEIYFTGPSNNGLPPGEYTICQISLHFYNPASPVTPDLPILYEYKTGREIKGNEMHWLRVVYFKEYFSLFGSYNPDPYSDNFGLIMSSKKSNSEGESECNQPYADFITSCPTGTEYIWPHKFKEFFEQTITVTRAITNSDTDLYDLPGFIKREGENTVIFDEW